MIAKSSEIASASDNPCKWMRTSFFFSYAYDDPELLEFWDRKLHPWCLP
jgi:hypothetical protein